MFKKTIVLLSIMLVLLPSVVFAQSAINQIVKQVMEAGVLRVMISILFAIIVFAILTKSKVLGENVMVAGFIAVVVAFMVFIYPTISGFSLEEPFSVFFTQIGSLLILLVFAFIVSSLFYPDMPKMLAQQFAKPNIIYVMIFLVIVLVIISRVAWVLWTGITEVAPEIKDVVILVAGIVVFIMLLYVAVAAGGGGK